MGFIWVIMRWR